MAAIDKIYVNDYYEYDNFRRWAIVYYPELVFWFGYIDLRYSDFEEMRSDYVKDSMEIAKRDHNKLGEYKDKEEAINNLIENYRITADYECSVEQAADEVEHIIESYNRTAMDWEYKFSFPILNTPFSVDKKLKWICPIPFVRKYLHEQCGVNPKYEWFYRLFWRGKKHFLMQAIV